MTSSFRVYIDESGDEGFKFLPDEQGSSRWLVLSALVFRRENDLLAVELAKQARELLKKPHKHPLHFRELKHEQRVPLARLIGQVNARAQFPNESLATLYDPDTMPPVLTKAHSALDKAVDAAYVPNGGAKSYATDAERVAFLFKRYQQLTSLI